MNLEEIESELRRLAPWYYLFDLNGIRTDITPPFDDWGHRSAEIPHEVQTYLSGKTILDVGCNEGGFAFAACRQGARGVTGFDARPINIAKARFVARVLGVENVVFKVGSVDTWPTEEKFDVVFMCGILYHLPKPWDAVRKYCAIARESILVTTMLHGGADGYSSRHEGETIASCENPLIPSMTPNTCQTVINEYAKYGFAPSYVLEYTFNGSIEDAVLTEVPDSVTDQGSCWIFFRR